MNDTNTLQKSCNHVGQWMDCVHCLHVEVARLRKALQPFADMHRECDLRDQELDRVVCQRGVASDLTMLTNRSFANANDALKSEVEMIPPQARQSVPPAKS